jgi:hypothetical protein
MARTTPNLEETRLQAARDVITEASQLAGMDELVQEARAIVGRGSSVSDQSAEDHADTAEAIRIRQQGASYGFRSEGLGPPPSSPISWSLKTVAPAWQGPWPWLVGSIGLLIATGSAIVVARPIRRLRGPGLVAVLSMALLLLALEPLGTGLAMTIAVLGRLVD